MTRSRPRLLIYMALSAAAAMWACASSGGGISGTNLVIGPIIRFDSIVVDDITFDTTNAVVTIEGNSATIDDLKLGMYVFVRGPVDEENGTGVAERIASDHLVEGPVDAVNAVDGTFVALSQLIVTDADTVFDQVTMATLAPGDVVEVFGVRDADLSIRATRVERKEDFEEFELTGTVANLDTAAQTFEIGLLTVDFSGALIEGGPPEGLSNGLVVEAETEEQPINDLMLAVGIEVLDPDLLFEDGDGVDVNGFVTSIVSPNEFVLNHNQTVTTTSRTRFENGTAADLVLNAEVDVQGERADNGVLKAEEIEFVGN
jgi:hypothetical protein